MPLREHGEQLGAAGLQDDIPMTERVMIVIVIDYLVELAIKLGWALARYEDSFYSGCSTC
jgi:hypothetical protein